MAEFYIEYLADVFSDEWEDFEVSYSHGLGGKWDWVFGFTFTDVVSPEPLGGIGEAYITQLSDEITFIVQWDGPEVLSDECKRIVDTFAPTNKVLSLQIISVTSPVSPGANATLVAQTTPGAECSIIVYYKSGPSTATGLMTPKTADNSGRVSWTWKVGTRTTPGSWQIVVSASYEGQTVSQDTYFTVR
jgi:hypothetical protein